MRGTTTAPKTPKGDNGFGGTITAGGGGGGGAKEIGAGGEGGGAETQADKQAITKVTTTT